MTSNFQLSGRLPGNETNGLEEHYDTFLEQGGPTETTIAVVEIQRKKWAHDDVTGEPSAIARITRIEVAEGDDRKHLVQTLNRLTSARTGDAQLDLDGTEEDSDDAELDIDETPAATVSDFPPLTPDFSDTPEDDGPKAA
ncbi:hypothetical protein [Pseudoclavibacter sp. 8L]|uniref:hypothetical protein n=1 Tax=Pseudoclavibacter sp. 8L TaxID=2653162 RepID=UPI0012F13779|nr:hypothetical protein [Pseudoclavibacter sp. 8L]VXB76351.1 conserved hypothetical protein [Pseudoclavibacter sp. 8L]